MKAIKVTFISLTISFITICCCLFVIPHKNEKTLDVFNNTIRLRVVANSDTEHDQLLKQKVRDGIIGTAQILFSDCQSLEDAKTAVQTSFNILEQRAKEVLLENGSEQEVKIRLVKEKCPVRRYNDFTFPSGEYLTLRIDLGKATGENWWCVMYPPLCLDAASDSVYADIAVFKNHGFTDKQIEQLTSEVKEKPRIKFALFELFGL